MDKAKIRDALVQLALRMIPLLPANEMKGLYDALIRSDSETETQVGAAIKSLEETAAIISQLESSMRDKTERLNKLQEEYKKYQDATTLSKEQISSLSHVLRDTIERSRFKEMFTHLAMHLGVGIVFLIAGVLLEHPIKEAWHSILGLAP